MLAAVPFIAIAAATAAAPSELAAPSNAAVALRAQGRGVQVYVCAAPPDQPHRFEWRFEAPEANLFTADGQRIGRHYAGPTWEGLDGGKVVGEVRAHTASPDPAAIDWLLLSAKAANKTGVLGFVSYIQRLNTTGGRAPTGGCSAETAGDEVRVPYSAEYDFYTSR